MPILMKFFTDPQWNKWKNQELLTKHILFLTQEIGASPVDQQ